MTSGVSYRESGWPAAGWIENLSLWAVQLPPVACTSEDECLRNVYQVSLEIRDHLELAARLRPTRELRPGQQAILTGHMVRLFKLYDTFLLLLLAAGRAEVADMFCRLITETGIHLLFLLKRGNAEVFQSYRRASLAYKKKLLLKAGEWKGTPRLTNEEFAGIESVTKASFEREGLKLDDAELECKWGGPRSNDIFKKAAATGTEYHYEIGFRYGSQILHGTWLDLEQFHLLRLLDGYGPNTSYKICNWQTLDTLSSFSVTMAVAYLLYITSDRKHPLVSRMAEFREWLVRMGEAGEEFRKQTRTSKVH